MPTLESLTLGLILYVILPLWAICGSLDYLCHRATHIESTSGLKESVLHSLMGILIGIPLWMAIFFEMNVLVLLICFAMYLIHEVVAHYDIKWAQPVRHITIWEQHLHAYLGTIPFYLMALIICRNWPVFIHTLSLDWTGEFYLRMRPEPVGSIVYVQWYAALMLIVAIIPYTEELFRCWRASATRD